MDLWRMEIFSICLRELINMQETSLRISFQGVIFFLSLSVYRTELNDVLACLHGQTSTDLRKNLLNVDRDDVLNAGMRAFKRPSSNVLAELSIHFLDEPGIDDGGLRREFMQLALKGLKRLPILGGHPARRTISLDSTFKYTVLHLKIPHFLGVLSSGPFVFVYSKCLNVTEYLYMYVNCMICVCCESELNLTC